MEKGQEPSTLWALFLKGLLHFKNKDIYFIVRLCGYIPLFQPYECQSTGIVKEVSEEVDCNIRSENNLFVLKIAQEGVVDTLRHSNMVHLF